MTVTAVIERYNDTVVKAHDLLRIRYLADRRDTHIACVGRLVMRYGETQFVVIAT